MPPLKLARIILFTPQIDAMTNFYGKVLALKQSPTKKVGANSPQEQQTSRSIPAHHRQSAKAPKSYSTPKTSPPYAKRSSRTTFGKVRQGEIFCLCDGKDPDGNPIQLSNR